MMRYEFHSSSLYIDLSLPGPPIGHVCMEIWMPPALFSSLIRSLPTGWYDESHTSIVLFSNSLLVLITFSFWF